MLKLILFATLVALSGCGLIDGFATPYAYFPRDRDADRCPPHFVGHFPSYREAMGALHQGRAVRRHSWMVAAPGEICLTSANASAPFLLNYDVATGQWGRFIVLGHGAVRPWEPNENDKVADDWESV
jgi:hypothetical protein